MKKTIYRVGDRVQVKSAKGHDSMTMAKKGNIAEIATPALGIKFDGMTKVHKWYTDDEVKSGVKAKPPNRPMPMPMPKPKPKPAPSKPKPKK